MHNITIFISYHPERTLEETNVEIETEREREYVCVCVCVCVCVRTTRGKSGCTTCTKYTIFSVKTGCTWLPLNLEESNIQVGTAILPFFNLFIRFKTNLSFSFIRLFRLREYYQLLPVLEISSFP